MRRLFVLLLSLSSLLGLRAQERDWYLVDCTGGGDFSSIQECFDALPSKPEGWRVVFVAPGEYREKLTLDVYKDKLCLVGLATEDGALPRIVWDDHTGRMRDGHEMTTYDTWTLSIQADDVYLQGLEIVNEAPLGAGQAVALETRGDRIWIDRCRLVGNQDTFFTKGYVSRVCVVESYIEGTTDFIFGPSIVWFEECEIRAKSDSYVTAASTTERNKYGYLFHRCRLTAAPEVTKLYLGRPWKSTARTVWMDCELDAPIMPEGWRDWHDSARKGAVYYAESGCTGRGADRSGRVSWSYELTAEERADYTIDNVFYKKTGSEQFYDSWSPSLERLQAVRSQLETYRSMMIQSK